MNETLQFPLPLLAPGPTVHDRLQMIIIHATLTTGQHRLKVLTPELVERELGPLFHAPRPNKKLNAKDIEDIGAIALGCSFCGINRPEFMSGYEYWLSCCRSAEIFLESWKAKGRSIPWTRVPKQMVFEAREGNVKIYRRFSALCAVNAAIGSKPLAIVTTGRVRAGMGGYASGKMLFAKDGTITHAGAVILAERSDGWTPPTRSQVRTLLDNLVKSGLAHRFNEYHGGLTYYSKELSAEKIAENLLLRANRKASNPKLQKLSEAIRQAKQDGVLLSGDLLPKSPHNTDSPHNREVATQPPPARHPVATQSPHNASSYAALNASSKCLQLNAEARSKDESVEKGNGETFTLPTLAKVKEFAAGLDKRATSEQAAEWFALHGTDPKWTTRPWKLRCGCWLLNAIHKSTSGNDGDATA